MTDLLQRLRDVNPVPACAPPSIENVWRRLDHEHQVFAPDVGQPGRPAPTQPRWRSRTLSHLSFGVGRLGLAAAVAVPVLVAALAIALLSHQRGHGLGGASRPGPTVPRPSQRLADGNINCFFGRTDRFRGHTGPEVMGARADGRSPVAICREWYHLNAHTGRKAADVAFVACQANATTVDVYVADGRSHQCQRLGDRPLPRMYAAAIAHLHALVQALATDQRRHDCVSVSGLAGEVRVTLARLGFVGWRLNLPSTHFDPRFDPPRGTGGTCGHVLGNPVEIDAHRRIVFIAAGPPTSVMRVINHVSYELYARSGQRCFTPTSVRALIRHAFAATPLRPRFATVAGPAGVHFGPAQVDQRYQAGCVRFALAVPGNNERYADVLLYARGAGRLPQGRFYPPAKDFRP
jgi:hypothetical protein